MRFDADLRGQPIGDVGLFCKEEGDLGALLDRGEDTLGREAAFVHELNAGGLCEAGARGVG